jgi:hypothetical protein
MEAPWYALEVLFLELEIIIKYLHIGIRNFRHRDYRRKV